MTINEYLTNTASITPEVIETQRAELGEKQSAALKACEEYQADITAQKDRIKAQAAKYAEELAKLEALEKKQAAAVAQAVARGDQNKAATAEAELDKTTEKIAAMKKKHNLMTTAVVKGDPALYAKAKAAMEDTDAASEAYRARLEAMLAAISKESKRLDELADLLRETLGYRFGRRDFAQYARSEFTKVNRHFRDLDRLEAEAKKKADEQRAAEERERSRNVHIFDPEELLRASRHTL